MIKLLNTLLLICEVVSWTNEKLGNGQTKAIFK